MTRGPRANLPQGTAGRFPLTATAVLIAAALLPPAALVLSPGGLALFLLPRSGIVLALGLIAAPLAAALAAAIGRAGGGERRPALARIVVAAGFALYLCGLAWVRPRDAAGPGCSCCICCSTRPPRRSAVRSRWSAMSGCCRHYCMPAAASPRRR
jgi:hypothetical protein